MISRSPPTSVRPPKPLGKFTSNYLHQSVYRLTFRLARSRPRKSRTGKVCLVCKPNLSNKIPEFNRNEYERSNNKGLDVAHIAVSAGDGESLKTVSAEISKTVAVIAHTQIIVAFLDI